MDRDKPPSPREVAFAEQMTDELTTVAALLHDITKEKTVSEQREIIERSGYMQTISGDENEERRKNVEELLSTAVRYEDKNEESATLAGFLEEIALYTDLEQYDAGDDAVVMMTMHSAKGLEFPNVFLVGFEDGLFPGMRAIGDHEEMEEERRLCYVAITRAKENLTISHARQRMLYGRTNSALASRFLREIPDELIVRKGNTYTASSARIGPNTPKVTVHPSSYSYQPSVKTTYLELNKGDMVLHTAFGKGMVLSVVKMGGDALLEIAFDQIGTKKLMAKTASAHLKKL